ncbi:hypothetical protein LCGC14_0863030 [marine sediment metagenome]|uniref:GIY-YIG domain-containing protein n=1 Tax=marine sediment metagenome TaxID=412755 RepID=A0A0F9RRJ3_9ZZZZ
MEEKNKNTREEENKFKIFKNEFIEIKAIKLEYLNFFIHNSYPINDSITNIPAVYFILGKKEEILYIGKSKKLRNRLCAHLSPFTSPPASWIPKKQIKKVRYLIVEEDMLDVIEAIYHGFYDSKYNNNGHCSEAKRW